MGDVLNDGWSSDAWQASIEEASMLELATKDVNYQKSCSVSPGIVGLFELPASFVM